MKRLLFSLLAFALIPLWCWGQRTLDLKTGAITSGISDNAPVRTVTNASDGIIITYTFSQMTLREDPLFNGQTLCSIQGFGENSIGEEPAVLFREDRFVIPANTSTSIEILESSYKDFTYTLGPARELLSDNNYDSYTTENVLPVKPFSGYFPNTTVTACDTQIYRGVEMLSVLISPLQYNYQLKRLRAYNKLKFKIKYGVSRSSTQQDSETLPIISSEDSMLGNITLNHNTDETDSSSPQVNQAKDYLVLCTSTTKTPAEVFKSWKRRLGYRVHIISRNDWTSEIVQSTVKEFYKSHPSLYYLLILGDHNAIPAKEINKKVNDYNSYVTDYYYSCMDDNDEIADIYCGRIPLNSSITCQRVIVKARDYTFSPAQDDAFYATGVNCTYFQDKNDDHYADRRFAQTSEEIRDYMIGQGKTVKRIYYAADTITPLYWNLKDYSFGEPIPDELKKPGFAWDGSAQDITDAINEGAFYVFHRDHGSVDHWDEPLYTTNDISKLSNGKKYPVVFSINCLTGRFNAPNECFASKFLNMAGGCCAIIAASNPSYTTTNNALACGIFDAIWPYPGLRPAIRATVQSVEPTPAPTYTLGQILWQGQQRMSEMYPRSDTQYSREIFHCFGDPSMEIYTEKPTAFANV